MGANAVSNIDTSFPKNKGSEL